MAIALIKLSTNNKEPQIRKHCQTWLEHVSKNDFEKATSLIDEANCYGIFWDEKRITSAVSEYFGDDRAFVIKNVDIERCCPNFLVTKGSDLILDFNLYINEECSDLTIQFEFHPKEDDYYSVSIHDIHVL